MKKLYKFYIKNEDTIYDIGIYVILPLIIFGGISNLIVYIFNTYYTQPTPGKAIIAISDSGTTAQIVSTGGTTQTRNSVHNGQNILYYNVTILNKIGSKFKCKLLNEIELAEIIDKDISFNNNYEINWTVQEPNKNSTAEKIRDTNTIILHSSQIIRDTPIKLTHSELLYFNIWNACVWAPITEELLFRYFIFNVILLNYFKMNLYLSIFISSLLFGAVHLNNFIANMIGNKGFWSPAITQSIYTFFLGIVMCYGYHETQNLLIPYLLHLFNNIIATIVNNI